MHEKKWTSNDSRNEIARLSNRYLHIISREFITIHRARTEGLLKSGAIMAAGTVVSRLTGFLRTVVTGAVIGAGSLNDTYQVANVLPPMIYALVGGGALNAVFVPQLVRSMKTTTTAERPTRTG